jgi:hypothetical protein
VEDADQSQLVDIYTWIHIANQVVGFAAPLAGLLIGMFTLVPTVRGLYVFAAILFTLKAVITYLMTEETAQGKVRMHETRHQSIMSVFREYGGVLQELLRTPQTLYTAGILLIISISNVISGSFWGIIVTERLHILAQNLAIFPFVRSAVMLFFFFIIMPRFNKMHYKLPLVSGFLGFIVSQLLLITAPDRGYVFLITSVFLEACCLAVISPLIDQMVVLTIDQKERARIQSMLYVGVILVTSPFGWIAGNLSALDKSLPFILNIVMFGAGAVLAYLAGNAAQKRLAITTVAP